ncbi:MAG: hypothetical protein FJW30_11435 [Acidobacteria bacterium]|nr:hypothetical protein [Acidobacteriota bacterium]
MLTADQYNDTPAAELLKAAADGRIGFDQQLIASLLSRGGGTAGEISDYYLANEEEWRVNIGPDVFHVLRALRSTAAIPVYAQLLHEQDDEDPGPIYDALAELGPEAIEPLLLLHAKAGPESQSNIEFLLAGLRVRDERIAALLKARLESDPADGAINISLYGDSELRPLLEARLGAELSPHEKHEIEFAIDQLSTVTIPDSPEPFDINSLYPPTAPPAFDVLDPEEMIQYLDHPSAEVRKLAAEGLANEELNESEVKRVLEAAEEDEDPAVRAQAWQALASAMDDDSVQRRVQARCFDDTASNLERAGAACALAELEMTDELAELLQEFYADPASRAIAMKGMWHSFDQQFSEVFPKHLDDADEDVQRQAIWGCGYLGIRHVAGQLEALFENENVREHALFAYALSCPAEISRGRAKALYEKIFELAGGLGETEVDVVQAAIDQRLGMHGLEPVFAKQAKHAQ